MLSKNKNLLAKAKELRQSMTDAERLLWYHLRAKRTADFKFKRQDIIGNYIVDFVCPTKKLIIEIDGDQHSNQTIYDENRTKYLENLGSTVMRFWNNEVLKNIEGVLQMIMSKLSPSPLSPPDGRGNGKTPSARKNL